MADIIKEKKYPDNYPKDITKILDAMSVGGSLVILGSYSLRSAQYSADIDAYEVAKVESAADAAKRFKRAVEKTAEVAYVGDIKCGDIEEWRVIDKNAHISGKNVIGYNGEKTRDAILNLHKDGVISAEESEDGIELAKNNPSPEEFLAIKEALRFNIVRWNVKEIRAGKKILRDGREYTLEMAVSSPSVIKLDSIGLVANNRYIDFSNIYQFYLNGKPLNDFGGDIEDDLKESTLYYLLSGNYFKAAKRMFALSKYINKLKVVNKLEPLLNGDHGIIYQISSDIGTLLFLLKNRESVPLKNVGLEIDEFRGRLANVYKIKNWIRDEPKWDSFIKMLSGTKDKKKLENGLEKLKSYLDSILRIGAKKYLVENGLYPAPKFLLP